ncbi:hypothetical protein DFA_01793 [Cavenderia fasciculata]|uniref:Uncharacterized protein n=1 Tax=Cavenderia fasciculata TaxID=261658 RepID=F4PUU5_CACFS|nr:uncharacterized protein DFA_01793 [Cavenderia fasciculata]EGG21907.1 hypothetical protein DFA_01793 [Cavenderia fasciculata]|eukprot:XP_004359758.1 hypothetical protein DFA_01793 [Cavenderia fasciculata]
MNRQRDYMLITNSTMYYTIRVSVITTINTVPFNSMMKLPNARQLAIGYDLISMVKSKVFSLLLR